MIFKDIFVYPRYPENLGKLYLLSQNLWCTWNYDAINLFYRIDAQLFREVNHNPVKFLLMLPKDKISELSQDKGFLVEMEKVWAKFQAYMTAKGILGGDKSMAFGLDSDDMIAYFSMEFGLHESMPIYGGGLGILAGDFLKGASSLGLSMTGIGLLYKFGYFTQRVNLNGQQEELYIEFENHLVPIQEVRNAKGEKAYIEMKIIKDDLKVKLWQIEVGRTKLILLDTDIEENPPRLRAITHELYVTDRTRRLQQELVLGVGGVKALEFLNINPRIYHINEGHAVFLVLARLQKLMVAEKMTFSQARALIRASTVFTTHTPVIAGNEHFESKLTRAYIEPLLKDMDVSFDRLSLFALVENDPDIFWLPALAIKFAKYVNCVSKLHRDVSRRLWANLFPKKPIIEIPIDYVTNGVHESWLSEHYTNLLNRHVGPDHTQISDSNKFRDKIMAIPDDEIWEAHRKNKQYLVNFARNKLTEDLTGRGYSPSRISSMAHALNPEYLTVVFARRFAHYKRSTLILKDKERLKKILTDSRKPVQIIFAGKAHPADGVGKSMIKDIVNFSRDYKLEDRVLFLENYDINVARHLVWGADVWLNTPIRENEASGTSGMKAAINGVLNLSVMDGWWPEGYNGRNGWSITAGELYRHSDLQETAEANQIYNLLEEEITEVYYDRNEVGIPQRWVRMMKESISSIYGKFNMDRVLMDYLKKFYGPAKKDLELLSVDNCKHLQEATLQEAEIVKYWDGVEMTGFSTNVDKKEHLIEDDRIEASCTVNLGKAPPLLFTVELFYMLNNKASFKIVPMVMKKTENAIGFYECSFEIEGYGVQNINARIKPANETVQDLHPEWVKWKE